MEKKKVLFICTHNSARSQMAEGILRKLYGDSFEVYSAGTQPGGVHPLSIEVMKEKGIDISSARSEKVDEYFDTHMDYVVTVCQGSTCPFFPSAGKVVHKSFPDPSSYEGEDKLEFFRKVRDKIFSWIEDFFNPLYRGEKNAAE